MRAGAPLPDVARRSGIRTKLNVNMEALGEFEAARLTKYNVTQYVGIARIALVSVHEVVARSI